MMLSRPASAVFIGAALCASLVGCSGHAPDPTPPAPTLLVEPTPAEAPSQPVSATPVHATGTGSELVTVNAPAGARFLHSHWQCSSGTGSVVLQEQTADVEKGDCGSDSGYQMSLPQDVTVLHFQITVDPGTTWTFGGTFS
ncbi:hypothetical protein [Humibacter ginsenosidimutans]|uniref:Uncharacterized protein n=1 Tax=Humibacter ginsenosidimutans TaxID=2599293 RepID=A0A5B8M5C7_9MICO|nr:hypothetical protein [Humibacter ginsenosidimutans]QDZ15573.1 hypothetical protein FPZ11_13105 [Humibacter ginsenosidimutans]